MQFLASLIGSLAWPIVVLVVALVFRSKIIELLSPTMKRLKAGPFEVEWDRTISEAEENLPVESASSAAESLKPAGPVSRMYLDTALRYPYLAIASAAKEVEFRLYQFLSRTIPKDQLRTSLTGLVEIGRERQAISEETAQVVELLYKLRSIASHGEGRTTAAQALEFLQVADYAAEQLK